MAAQTLLFPWAQKKWIDIKRKLNAPCKSIVELETMMASARIKQRRVIELFTIIYGDAAMSDKLPSRDHFVTVVVPWMQTLIVAGPKTFPRGQALLSAPGIATMTRVQAATVLACMFFGLLGINRGAVKASDLPEMSFKHVFENQRVYPLQCLIGYFTYAHSLDTATGDHADIYHGGIIAVKRVTGAPQAWVDMNVPLCDVTFGTRTADDSSAKMHLVSTDAIIGGDALFAGSLTPEQIILLARPEAIALAILCPQLGVLDAVVIMGAEKINMYGGMGASVIYQGLNVDITPRGYSDGDTEVMTQCALVFVDACTSPTGQSQFIEMFMRDLNKMYAGASALKWREGAVPIFAADPWRSGFIGNNIQLKFIQLWIATSAAGVQLCYHPTSDDLEEAVSDFVEWVQRDDMTCAQLLAYYATVATSTRNMSKLSALDLFTEICDR